MLENVAQYQIVTKPQPTFYFIGVTTAKSSIMKVFPSWTKELGRSEVGIEGVDLILHDSVEAYQQVVAQIKYDLNSLGALVTAHKSVSTKQHMTYSNTWIRIRKSAARFRVYLNEMANSKGMRRTRSARD